MYLGAIPFRDRMVQNAVKMVQSAARMVQCTKLADRLLRTWCTEWYKMLSKWYRAPPEWYNVQNWRTEFCEPGVQNGTKCCQNGTERRQNGTTYKTGGQSFARLVYRMTQMSGQFRTKRRQNGTTYKTGGQSFPTSLSIP